MPGNMSLTYTEYNFPVKMVDDDFDHADDSKSNTIKETRAPAPSPT